MKKSTALIVCLALAGVISGCTTTEPARMAPEANPYVTQGRIQFESSTTKDIVNVVGIESERIGSGLLKIYVTFQNLAKRTGIPVILLAQLNRSTYTSGIPKMNHIRYSGLAEAASSLIMLLYNPNQIWADKSGTSPLPSVEGKGYIILAKSRFGFGTDDNGNDRGVGALDVDWNGKNSWGNKLNTYRILS